MQTVTAADLGLQRIRGLGHAAPAHMGGLATLSCPEPSNEQLASAAGSRAAARVAVVRARMVHPGRAGREGHHVRPDGAVPGMGAGRPAYG
ncbi:hypothetical protein Stsp02_71210 [Streptomyces sp. NBRC 14336]|nr:hypothetical protein Stsp02_71210 [Streptomyces sp. NBRC 14336]